KRSLSISHWAADYVGAWLAHYPESDDSPVHRQNVVEFKRAGSHLCEEPSHVSNPHWRLQSAKIREPSGSGPALVQQHGSKRRFPVSIPCHRAYQFRSSLAASRFHLQGGRSFRQQTPLSNGKCGRLRRIALVPYGY